MGGCDGDCEAGHLWRSAVDGGGGIGMRITAVDGSTLVRNEDREYISDSCL